MEPALPTEPQPQLFLLREIDLPFILHPESKTHPTILLDNLENVRAARLPTWHWGMSHLLPSPLRGLTSVPTGATYFLAHVGTVLLVFFQGIFKTSTEVEPLFRDYQCCWSNTQCISQHSSSSSALHWLWHVFHGGGVQQTRQSEYWSRSFWIC